MEELKNLSQRCITYQDPTLEIDPRQISIRLLFNENLVLPKEYYEEIVKYIKENIDLALRYYPSAKIRKKITEEIAKIYKIDENMIYLTAGADEAMKLIFDICNARVDKILILRPCYGMPLVYAHNTNMKIISKVLTRDYKIPKEEIVEHVNSENIELIYICNPNNPLSIEFNIEDIEYIVKNVDSIVMIDETYHDYGDQDHSKLVKKYENVIVIRSLSKSWGLAGLRVGYMIASEYICKLANAFAQPFNISSIALIALEKAIQLYDIVKKYVEYVKDIRKEIIEKIKNIKHVVEVFNSKTNFITFRLDSKISAVEVKEKLKNYGYYVRLSNEPMLENCLRVTIASRDIMYNFIDTLEKILNEYRLE